ncbi:N-acetylneuraminate synthase family protein [Crocinitomix sp.]|nr:N-acetylneuraminate synthase family protein [Crocinitomix sp.]
MKAVKEINIGNITVAQKGRVYIIAEAGVNHGGDIEVAKKLVDVAVNAKVDAVKFQAFRTEHLIIEDVEKAPYQQETTGNKQSQADMLRGLELRYEHYEELKNYCESKGVHFLITPFDEFSLKELENLGVLAYKIASTDTTNLPFIRKVAKTGKPIILSTGMCEMNEVESAVNEVLEVNQNLILLQCTANYPMADEEANLNVITTYKKKFDCIVGYSDHSVGLGAAPFAIPLGATVLEKHFTLNKADDGPDHLASLDPHELIEFVQIVRRVELFLGSSQKTITTSENATKKSLQKCLVALKPIVQGELLSLENIVAKRTGGNGISPLRYKEIIGTKAKKDFKVNELIS